MFIRCSNSSSDILAAAHQNMQTVIDATQEETAIYQQQHSCETLVSQRHQTIHTGFCPVLPRQAHSGEFVNLSDHIHWCNIACFLECNVC